MFKDHETKPVQFVSCWEARKKLRENATQTREVLTYEVESQTRTPKHAESQTESLLSLMESYSKNSATSTYDMNNVAAFLKKVEPVILKQLAVNNATVAAHNKVQKAREGANENSITCETCLLEKSAVIEEGSKERALEATCVSWSRTGASLAVSFGTNENVSWSEDRSYICLWNLDRPKLKLNESDQKLELGSSAQTVLFHPEFSGYIAAGLFSGVVLIWDLAHDDVAYGESAHDDPVTGLCWFAHDNPKYLKLLSSSTDGKFIVWTYKKGRATAPLKIYTSFVITAQNLPRRVGIRGNGRLGISCFYPTRSNVTAGEHKLNTVATSGTVVCGCENGLVIKCWIDCDDANPVTFVYESHQGPVYSVDWSPFNRNLFLTSSTDQTCRIYHQLEAAPLREIRPSWLGTRRMGENLLAAVWSVTRPTVVYTASSCGHVEACDVITTESLSVTESDGDGKQLQLACINSMQANPSRPDVVATGAKSGHVRVWRLGAGLTSSLAPGDETKALAAIGAGDVTTADGARPPSRQVTAAPAQKNAS